jgi:hypothetical protein
LFDIYQISFYWRLIGFDRIAREMGFSYNSGDSYFRNKNSKNFSNKFDIAIYCWVLVRTGYHLARAKGYSFSPEFDATHPVRGVVRPLSWLRSVQVQWRFRGD